MSICMSNKIIKAGLNQLDNVHPDAGTYYEHELNISIVVNTQETLVEVLRKQCLVAS